jgi:hypothetical protein
MMAARSRHQSGEEEYSGASDWGVRPKAESLLRRFRRGLESGLNGSVVMQLQRSIGREGRLGAEAGWG